MKKTEIYDHIEYGKRAAENEESQLEKFFYATRYWDKLIKGEADIILGHKGAGKSALYLYLLTQKEKLRKECTFLLEAEDIIGDTVLSMLNQLTNREEELRFDHLIEKDITNFWKLYFLNLIITNIKFTPITEHKEFKELRAIFEDSNLIPTQSTLRNIIKKVLGFISGFKPEIEVELDTKTNNPIFKIKPGSAKVLSSYSFNDSSLTIDDLYEIMDKVLEETKQDIWIAIDRLDVAFDKDENLEAGAIKALFYVYNSLRRYKNIRLKIFLREDLWDKLLNSGLGEASHIEKLEMIRWRKNDVFFLMIKRIVSNPELCAFYDVIPEEILSDREKQEALFYKIFPLKIRNPENEEEHSFDWMLNILSDGKDRFTPREFIHLLSEVNTEQKYLCKTGYKVDGEALYSEDTLKLAIQSVADTRFNQTLKPENPKVSREMVRIRNSNNAHIDQGWLKNYLSFENDRDIDLFCDELEEIGFFKRVFKQELDESGNTIEKNTFWIPYLYRKEI